MAEQGTKKAKPKQAAKKPAGKKKPAAKGKAASKTTKAKPKAKAKAKPKQAAKKPAAKRAKPKKLTVAVTGPTGDIGIAALRALDDSPKVGKVIGMARRPFDPPPTG